MSCFNPANLSCSLHADNRPVSCRHASDSSHRLTKKGYCRHHLTQSSNDCRARQTSVALCTCADTKIVGAAIGTNHTPGAVLRRPGVNGLSQHRALQCVKRLCERGPGLCMPAKPALDLSQVLVDLRQHRCKDQHMPQIHLQEHPRCRSARSASSGCLAQSQSDAIRDQPSLSIWNSGGLFSNTEDTVPGRVLCTGLSGVLNFGRLCRASGTVSKGEI